MFITEHPDGSVSYTGSFHREQWEAFLAEREQRQGGGGEVAGGEPATEPAAAAEESAKGRRRAARPAESPEDGESA
jgi:hypothetical protein